MEEKKFEDHGFLNIRSWEEAKWWIKENKLGLILMGLSLGAICVVLLLANRAGLL